MEEWKLILIIISGVIVGLLLTASAFVILHRHCCKSSRLVEASTNSPSFQHDVENQRHDNNVSHRPDSERHVLASSSNFEIIREEGKLQQQQYDHDQHHLQQQQQQQQPGQQQQHHQCHPYHDQTQHNDEKWAHKVVSPTDQQLDLEQGQGGSSQNTNEHSRQRLWGMDQQGGQEQQVELQLAKERWAIRTSEIQKPQQGLHEDVQQQQQESNLLQQRQLQLKQEEQRQRQLQLKRDKRRQRKLQLKQEEQRQRQLQQEKERQLQLEQQQQRLQLQQQQKQQQQQLKLQQHRQQQQQQQQQRQRDKQQRKNELLQRVLSQGLFQQRQAKARNLGQRLDLHFFSLKEAMDAFKLFLQVAEDDCDIDNSQQKHFVEVITGRGKHSRNGIPVIKPAVENYLRKHDYKFHYDGSNDGMVIIDLLRKSPSHTILDD